MDVRRILVFVVCGISAVSALTGKGYYCRDPETGFLHPANSTWQSTTFCGNYSCKLRKKNLGQTTPIRAINVTYNGTIQGKSTSDDLKAVKDDAKDTASANKPSGVLNFDNPELAILKSLLPLGLYDLSKLNDVHERLKHHQLVTGSGDRLLTDKEIKTISELLHNVKKSDLEAIVDIYNLAQDIYKEMDKMTSENIVEEAMRNMNSLNKPDGRRTYWYEPSYHKGLVKPDMDHQGSNIVTSSTTPPRDTVNPNSYFGGPLTKTDFGKLPYYYPMSSFQRQSSYVHPTYNAHPPSPPSVKPHCAQTNYVPPAPQLHHVPPYYPAPIHYPSPPQNYGGVLKKPFLVETQKQDPPASLLPYPFSYVQHYNTSGYPLNILYDGMSWAGLDINNNNNNQKSYYRAHFSQIPSNAVPATVEKKEHDTKLEADKKPDANKKPEVGSLIDTLLAGAKTLTKNKPEWKTDPIPSDILDDVRAHIEEKGKLLKPFSLRKKVKLERVGKVVKLDDLHREKRSLDNSVEVKLDEDAEEEYEAYIEKTTCLSDIDPGFFRMGNLSEPYPACCPQRINNDNR